MSKKVYKQKPIPYTPLGIFVALLVFLVLIAFWYSGIYAIKNIEIDYSIGDVSSFNLDDDIMHFGSITPGLKTQREIVLSYKKDAKATFKTYNLPHITVTTNPLYLKKDQQTNVMVTVNAPENVEKGYYHGKLIIIIKRPTIL